LSARKITYLFFSLLATSAIAQDGGNDQDVRHAIYSPFRMTIRGNGLVPHPVSNGAFRRSFNGIYDATFSVNVDVYKGINLGVMYQNSGFETPPNKIPQLNTKQQYNIGGVRLGYDYFILKSAVFSAAVNAGECYIKSYDIIPLKSTYPIRQNDKGVYVEPEVSISFYTDDNFGIGFNLSYEFIGNEFNPYALALDQHSISYSESDLHGYTQNLSFGFHFVYSFWKKKKRKS
jgi:hypothetical protein